MTVCTYFFVSLSFFPPFSFSLPFLISFPNRFFSFFDRRTRRVFLYCYFIPSEREKRNDYRFYPGRASTFLSQKVARPRKEKKRKKKVSLHIRGRGNGALFHDVQLSGLMQCEWLWHKCFFSIRRHSLWDQFTATFCFHLWFPHIVLLWENEKRSWRNYLPQADRCQILHGGRKSGAKKTGSSREIKMKEGDPSEPNSRTHGQLGREIPGFLYISSKSMRSVLYV